MTDHSEQDAGAVTRPVRQFRRLARLAGADPLRLLPPDPLTGLVSLGAPVTDLIDLAPFERLRAAFATVATTRSEAVRARVQPLVPGSKVRPHAPTELADRDRKRATQRDAGLSRATQRDAGLSRTTQRDAGLSRAAHAVAAATGGDVRAREDRGQGNTPAGTLAQRRRALRRSLPQLKTSTPQSLAAVARTSAPPAKLADPLELLNDERVRRANDYVSGAVAKPTGPLPPSQTESRGEVGEGRTLLGEAFRAALTALTKGDAVEAARLPAGTPPLTLEAETVPPAETASEASRTIGAAPANAGETGASAPSLSTRPVPAVGSPRPLPADSPIAADSAGRRRSRTAHAGLEITDELFEALYRSGVDQSWP